MSGVKIAIWVVAAVIAAVVVLTILFPGPDFERLKAEGEAMIDRLERYRAEHGEYPPDLASAHITAPPNRWGGWTYHSDGVWFEVATGKYERDSFVFFWASKRGHWCVDR